jgi:hypothetical protein
VPAKDSASFTLHETTGTDFTWVMQPLELDSLVNASDLADEIEKNASAPLGVLTVSNWNAIAQNYSIYYKILDFGDFDTRFGYPYQIEVDVSSGASVTWP